MEEAERCSGREVSDASLFCSFQVFSHGSLGASWVGTADVRWSVWSGSMRHMQQPAGGKIDFRHPAISNGGVHTSGGLLCMTDLLYFGWVDSHGMEEDLVCGCVRSRVRFG